MRCLVGALCALGAAAALALGGSAVSAWGPPPCDFLTGGGFIIYPGGPYTGKKANFGVGGGCKNGSGLGNPPAPYWGHLEYQDKAANLNVHWKTITGYMVDNAFFPDPKARLICGTAKTNRGDVTFIVRAKDEDHVRDGDDDDWDDWDDDEDGRNKDEFDIKLQGAVTYSTFGTGPHKLGGGNIRLHKSNSWKAGVFGGSCPGLPGQSADVSVVKMPENLTVNTENPAQFNITVSAGGGANSLNVQLTDPLPTGHTWTLSGPDAGGCAINTGNNLTCMFGTMISGSNRAISVTTMAAASDAGAGIDNTATVSSNNDSNTSNNSSSAHIDVSFGE